jgi:Carboxypeptidase regulatory-like domain
MVLSPRVTAPMVVVAPTPVVAAPANDDNDEAVEPDDGGTDLADVFVQLQAKDAQKRNDHLAIRGQVSDQTGQLLAGVTVIVTSPNLEGTQTAISDESGKYNVANLPAGDYTVTFYYADFTDIRDGIASREIEPTMLDEKIDTTPVWHEYPRYDYTIDQESTTQGITIDYDYEYNIPIPGRTFEAALGAAAGSQEDSYGVSFSGVTSVENTYVIE